MTNPFSIYCGKFEIKIDDFKKKKYKNLGYLMYQIASCSPNDCQDIEAYMELLEATAKEIKSGI